MKRILLALFSCLALAVCLLVLLEYPLKVDFMRGTLEHTLGSKLGCRVAIAGPIQAAIGFQPTLWLKDLSLTKSNSPGNASTLARIRKLKGKVELWSLLKGEVRLALLEISEIEVQIPPGCNQLAGFMRKGFSTSSGNESLTVFEVRRFSLNKLRIIRPAVGNGSEILLALNRVSGTMPLDAPLSLKAEGRYRDAPFNLEVSGPSLQTWQERTQPWPLALSLRTDVASLHFETAITPASNGADLSGRFTLAGSNIKSLGQFFGAHLPDFGSFDLQGRYEAKSAGLDLVDLTGKVGTLGESVFTGTLRLRSNPAGLNIAGRLEGNQIHIAKVAKFFVDSSSWRGLIDTVAFTGASHGVTLKDFLANLSGKMRLSHTSLVYDNQSSSQTIFLDRVIANFNPDQNLSGSIAGHWREEPFILTFANGTLAAYGNGEILPISLTARIIDTRLEGKGSLSRFTDTAGLSMQFKLTGRSLKVLRPWVSFSPQGDLPYRLDGRLMATSQGFSLTQLAGTIGRSDLAGEMIWRDSRTAPRLSVNLYSQALHWKELLSLTKAQMTRQVEHNGQRSQAYSVLGSLPSTDFELKVGRILGIEPDLRNLSTHGHVKAGALKASVSGDLGETEFAGNLEAEANAGTILARMHLSGHGVNISKLLKLTGVNQNPDLSVRFLELECITRGSTLETLADRLSTTICLKEGVIKGRTSDTRGSPSLVFSQALIKVPPHAPLTATAEVLFGKQPVKVQLRSDLGIKDRVPFALEARIADARLSLMGAVIGPWSRPQISLSFQLAGQNLNSLSFAGGPELPALGAYAVAGNFSATTKDYSLTGIDLRLGTSHLTGNLDFAAKGKRPRLKAQLAAGKLQLDDFVPYRQSFNNPARTMSTSMRQPKSRNAISTLKNLEYWLRQIMRRVDVDLQIAAAEVLSGTNRLGSGKVALTVKKGRLKLEELTGEAFGGEIDLGFILEEAGRKLKMETWGKVRHLDYRILARLMRPKAMKGGNLALDFRFTGVTPSMKDFLAHASGHFHAVVQPHQLEKADSGFWFVDFVFGIIPLLELGPASQVNCIVVNFNLKEGLAPGAALLIDLTDERIKGAGAINFKTRTLNLVFHPEPKKLVFKVPLPVRVSGDFTECRFTPTHRKFLVTLTHYITAPFKRLASLLFPGAKIYPCTIK